MDQKFPYDHFLNFKNSTEPNFPPLEIGEENNFLAPPVPKKKKISPPLDMKGSIQNEPSEPKNYQEQIHSFIRDLITPQQYMAYFKNSFEVGEVSGDKIYFNISTNFIKTILEAQYLPHIQESVKNVLGNNYQIILTTDPISSTIDPIDLKNDEKLEIPSFNFLSQPDNPTKKTKKIPVMKEARFHLDLIPSQEDLLKQVDSTVITHMEDHGSGNLIDHKKTFENFIVGPSNNIAYASVIKAMANPGKIYPCLHIHSSSGLGKTHLLNAVANHARETHPHLKVYLTTARIFMTEMQYAMANKKASEFRKKYSDHVDVLMIDDVHDFKNKSGTQNEFFHIFNELHNKGKQLIFTSDIPPKSIDGLEDRIKSRLSCGLVLDILGPDLETRISILKRKVIEEDIYLPDDVLSLIANSVKGNIRELEGSLIRLGAYASVMKVDIDFEIAREQLKISDIKKPHQANLESVAKAVSQYFKIPVVDICSKVRFREVTYARHIAMYLSYKLLKETLTQIGIFFGKRDHSSVLHAIDKISEQMKIDPECLQIVTQIEGNLKAVVH